MAIETRKTPRVQEQKALGTREKLLRTAAEVFAERGFRRATVRDIAARAGVNLNAVNYYFGDKQGLYEAVLESFHQATEAGGIMDLAGEADRSPSERLHAFVRGFLQRTLSKRQRPNIARLMALEMAEPTEALDMVVERFFRPRFNLLASIVRELAGEAMPQRQIEMCVQSIIGQCIHLVHAQPIATRLMPYLSYSPEDLDRVAEHITAFSLAALANLRTSNGETK